MFILKYVYIGYLSVFRLSTLMYLTVGLWIFKTIEGSYVVELNRFLEVARLEMEQKLVKRIARQRCCGQRATITANSYG